MIKAVTTDVDIDVFGRDQIVAGLECVQASIERDGVMEKHPTGVYLQNIPRNPLTGASTLDHKYAASLGYFKIDLLNVNFYSDVTSELHLEQLMAREPPWDFLLYADITDQLFHLKGHHRLLKKFRPQCVEDLAMVLAMIRPAKAHLQSANWDTVRDQIWKPVEDDTFVFKKSHSISYALAIVVHLNILVEKLSRGDASLPD